MAIFQRDDLIDAIRKTDALLEYAVMHGEEASLPLLGYGGLRPESSRGCRAAKKGKQ